MKLAKIVREAHLGLKNTKLTKGLREVWEKSSKYLTKNTSPTELIYSTQSSEEKHVRPLCVQGLKRDEV